MSLRKDGTFEIYKIQTRFPDYKNGAWFFANLDFYGYPEDFSASGDCWQMTGEIGTFSKDKAVSAIKELSIKFTEQPFRVVKQTISQKTTQIMVSKALSKEQS